MTSFRGLAPLGAQGDEPVTLGQVRAWLRLTDDGEDATVSDCISAARAHVESVTGLLLRAGNWAMTLDALPSQIAFPCWPVRSISAITYKDSEGASQNLPLAGWDLDNVAKPALLDAPIGFIPPAVAIKWRVEFAAGFESWNDVPIDVRMAVQLAATHLYENRGDGQVRSDMPDALAALVAPHRIWFLR